LGNVLLTKTQVQVGRCIVNKNTCQFKFRDVMSTRTIMSLISEIFWMMLIVAWVQYGRYFGWR